MSISVQNHNSETRDLTTDNDLPEGWVSVQLKDHVYIAGRIGWRGLKRSEYTQAGPLFLAVKDIRPDGVIDFTQTEHLSKARYDESPEIQVQPNDLLLTKDGTIGKVGMVRTLPSEVTINSSILVVRPTDALISNRYLFHFFRGPQFQGIARARIAGSAVPHLFQKDIKELTALVPPVPEQKRIVAKVEELFAEVNAARARLAKVTQILKRFRQTVFAAACSGRLTEDWRRENGFAVEPTGSEEALDGFIPLPVTWRWQRLESICSEIVDCPHSTPKWTDFGKPCLRTTNFKPGYLDLSEIRYVSESTFAERIVRLRPQSGDILYSREGGILGIACAIPHGIDVCLGQRMMLFRPSPAFRGELLMHWLNSPSILRQVQDLTGGSASPHLNVKDIRNFPIPVAPLTEQTEIVRRVEILFKLADSIERSVEKATKRADKLTQAILAKAFRGELIPTEAEIARREGREYESASELLARIKADRDELAKMSGGARAQRKKRNDRK